jgi:hypothetical protein
MARYTSKEVVSLPYNGGGGSVQNEIPGCVRDDFPYATKFMSMMPENYRLIRSLCLNKKLIVKYKGTVYMFLETKQCWEAIFSPTCSSLLCEMLGMRNVTVNQAIATKPYSDYAASMCETVSVPPNSFCISTRRLAVSVVGETLRFKQVKNVVPRATVLGETDSRYRGFCFNPLSLRLYPDRKYKVPQTSMVEKYMLNSLDEDSLESIMWVIGNGLLDPVAEPRIVYLYGVGGEGKSTFVHMVANVLAGSIRPLDGQYLSSNHSISHEDLAKIAQTRFVTCSDTTLNNDGKLNPQFLKIITGGDKVDSAIGEVTSVSTVFVTSNKMWYPYAEILQRWFTRRMLVIMIKKNIDKSGGPPPDDFPEEEKLNFIMRCIHNRLVNQYMPVSAKNAIVTMLGLRSGVSTRAIELGEASNFEESYNATVTLALSAGLEYRDMISLLDAISPNLIISVGLSKAMVAIRPKSEITWKMTRTRKTEAPPQVSASFTSLYKSMTLMSEESSIESESDAED